MPFCHFRQNFRQNELAKTSSRIKTNDHFSILTNSVDKIFTRKEYEKTVKYLKKYLSQVATFSINKRIVDHFSKSSLITHAFKILTLELLITLAKRR